MKEEEWNSLKVGDRIKHVKDSNYVLTVIKSYKTYDVQDEKRHTIVVSNSKYWNKLEKNEETVSERLDKLDAMVSY